MNETVGGVGAGVSGNFAYFAFLHFFAFLGRHQHKQVPVGTTMRPPACFTTFLRPAVELTDEQIFWAGLKHFLCDFRSGFTIVYGEKYAFLSLFTKALRANGWTNGRTDGHSLL